MTELIDRPTTAPVTPSVVVPTTATSYPARGTRRLPWRWLVVLGIGSALFLAVSATWLTTHDPIFLPTLLLLGAAVVPTTMTVFVSEVEGRRTRLTTSKVLTAAVLGGLCGGLLAGLLEFGTVRTLGSLPFPLIGFIEEAAKLAIPVALFSWGKSRGRAMDGLILGVAVGSGFAALETMGYGFVALLEARGQIQPVEDLLANRALASLGGHAAWTGLAAAAFFAIASARRRWWGWVRFLGTFAAVVALHAGWDATVGTGPFRGIALLSFAMLVVTMVWIHVRGAQSPQPIGNTSNVAANGTPSR